MAETLLLPRASAAESAPALAPAPALCPPPPADHAASIRRLRRIRGQVEGIIRMVEERRQCMDILTQTAAAKSALKAVELEILERHLRHCVRRAFAAPEGLDSALQELDHVVRRFLT